MGWHGIVLMMNSICIQLHGCPDLFAAAILAPGHLGCCQPGGCSPPSAPKPVIPVPSLLRSSTPPWPSPQYCDLGSLRHNLSAGRFHVRLPATDSRGRSVLAADFGAILDMALEVAEAVAYLHSIRLVHCDVKVGRCRAELFFAQLAVVPLCRCTPFTDSLVTPYA
jgi:hypothetical protein